ncbi:MAG: PadR family transcriptional regulator [Candidatus Bathyarchaeota archaeon]|nr:PadR family transcriptional regulator [Candidatus Bathyarchaeota archaeon]
MITIKALEKEIISTYDIIKLYKNRYNVLLSPGTVYPIFSAMEQLGYIKRISNRHNKLYILTEKGRKSLAQFHLEVGKIQKIISDIANI